MRRIEAERTPADRLQLRMQCAEAVVPVGVDRDEAVEIGPDPDLNRRIPDEVGQWRLEGAADEIFVTPRHQRGSRLLRIVDEDPRRAHPGQPGIDVREIRRRMPENRPGKFELGE